MRRERPSRSSPPASERGVLEGAALFAFAAVLSAACGGTSAELAAPASAATGTAKEPPPSIPVDPPFELPLAGATARAESGVVVLAAPPDPGPIRDVVMAFFDAVVAESTPGLERVVEASARARASSKARPDPALPWWRRRFEVLDYKALALSNEVFFFPSSLEIRTARDRPHESSTSSSPVFPRGEEVLVRVPIVGRGAAKLFGSEIVFLLKPQISGSPAAPASPYKIAELYEDFRLP
jgi:hypothetical protein